MYVIGCRSSWLGCWYGLAVGSQSRFRYGTEWTGNIMKAVGSDYTCSFYCCGFGMYLAGRVYILLRTRVLKGVDVASI